MEDVEFHVKEQIIEHAESSFPAECCGLIIENYGYYPCNNISDNPETEFQISQYELEDAYEIGNVISIVHSHAYNNDELSEVDKVYKEQTDCKWVLCVLDESGGFVKFKEFEVYE